MHISGNTEPEYWVPEAKVTTRRPSGPIARGRGRLPALEEATGRFARHTGRHSFSPFGNRKAVQKSLTTILDSNHFQLVYQPVVALAGRQVHHHEALLRLRPMRASVTTDTQSFVTLIEALGLTEAFDLAVIGKVLTTLRSKPNATIAVNVSGLSLQSKPFVVTLLDMISDASRLIIEITETAEITDMSAAADAVTLLRARGVRVCLDDFGAGYAAFRYLRDLSIDYLKIDGSFIQSAHRSPLHRQLIASMCALAAAAGAKIIAEMVESAIQADLMEEAGAVLGQGWLFGYPDSQLAANASYVSEAAPDLMPGTRLGPNLPRPGLDWSHDYSHAISALPWDQRANSGEDAVT